MEMYELYGIVIAPAAEKDLENIVKNLSKYSRQVAMNFYDLVYERIDGLSEMPKRYPSANDPQLQSLGFRTMFVKNCVVAYVVKGNRVIVRRIFSAKLEYEKLLVKELIKK
jgi:plasmid stabilization system protein ParE